MSPSRNSEHRDYSDDGDLSKTSFGSEPKAQRGFWASLLGAFEELGGWVDDPLGWVDEPFSTKQLFNPLNPLSPF